MTDYKIEASKWLRLLRGGTDMHEGFTGYLRQDLEKGGLTLEDIGTSDAELDALRVKGCETGALKWLRLLRGGTDRHENFTGYMHQQLEKGGLTLEDIGTSEAELDALRVKGCETGASKWLSILRGGTDRHENFTDYLRQDLEKGGLTLEDIGTSEKELKSFKKAA